MATCFRDIRHERTSREGRGCHPVKQQRHRQPSSTASEDGRAAERGEERRKEGGDERGEGCTRCSSHGLSYGRRYPSGYRQVLKPWPDVQDKFGLDSQNQRKNVKHCKVQLPLKPPFQKHSGDSPAANVSEAPFTLPVTLILFFSFYPLRTGSDQTCGNCRR